jgi:hypothetical protein
LEITQELWEALLWDPVMAAEVIFGVRLDAFQQARLRYYWFIHNVIDSSGFTSGKTIVDFLFANLRCILLPDQDVGVYYPVFSTGQNTFWPYYRRFKQTSPIFRAQLGRTDEHGEDDGSGQSEGAACYKAYYKNGNTLFMPAPSFMKQAATQASMRFNVLLIEEWTHIDAGSTGIDDQLIGRTTKPCWNQHHPIWGNHILLTAPKKRMHPAFKRWWNHQKEVARGNPAYANLHYSYKDYSNLICRTGKTYREEYRIGSTIDAKKNTTGKADWIGEGLGVWTADGEGWFSEQAILGCVSAGQRMGLKPVLSRRQFEEEMAGLLN